MRAADPRLWLLPLLAACAPVEGPSAAPAPPPEAAAQEHERAAIDRLPEGEGRTAVLSSCLICHGMGLVAQQRKDAAGWQRTVRQMVTWGAPVQPGQEEVIVAYLAQHFGTPAATASQ